MTPHELQKIIRNRQRLLSAGCGGEGITGNKEPIRIPFKIFKPLIPPVPGQLEAAGGHTNTLFGPNTDTSMVVWAPGLVHKTVEIIGLAADLVTNPVLIQVAISERDLKATDWYTLTAPIVAPGIYPIADTAASAIPFMFEPEVTLIRIIGYFNDGEGNAGVFPPSLQAVFAGLWFGEGDWCMRCTANYSGQ